MSPSLSSYWWKVDEAYSLHERCTRRKDKAWLNIKEIQNSEGNVKLRNVVIFRCIIRPACDTLHILQGSRHVKYSFLSKPVNGKEKNKSLCMIPWINSFPELTEKIIQQKKICQISVLQLGRLITRKKIIWPEECVQDTVNVAFKSREVPRSDRELRCNITHHNMTEKRNSLELEVNSQIFS